jgi:membrane fusion protein (multidrug efflux system)
VRTLITVLALLLLLGGLTAVKAAQIGTLVSNGKKAKEQGPPPEVVATAEATDQVWERTIEEVGSVVSAKGVTLSNETTGIVTRIHFDSGQSAKAGAMLVELDTNVERAQLASALARRQLAEETMARTLQLIKTGAVPKSQVDADRAQLETTTKDVAALESQISRKSVRAPFDGKLGIREVNLGQYLNTGTPITVIESARSLFVDFTTPQERLPELAVGMPVRFALAGSNGHPRSGAIDAIEPAVDATTRTVKIRANVENEDRAVRPGMFVNVSVVLPERDRVVVVPATAVVHASFGDSLFVVEDKPESEPGMRTTRDGKPVKIARQRFVQTGPARGDFVAVLRGLNAGPEVVTAGAFKLRNGAPIVVNNALQSKPELNPQPENR